MINQPFGSKPKWFTFRETTTFAWNPKGMGSAPRFSSPTNSSTLEVQYQSFKKGAPEQTIDLRTVTGWQTVPNGQGPHIFESETIVVYLSSVRKKITLHNQKSNPEVKLAKWDNQKRRQGPMEKVTIPQPELKQIDDFFDAMLAANLL